MRKTLLSLLLLLATLAHARIATPTGSALVVGQTYYLYNVGRGQYLSADDGVLTLGGQKLAVTITLSDDPTTAATYYALTTAAGALSYDLNARQVRADGTGTNAQWRLVGSTLPGGPRTQGAYIIMVRVREQNTALSLYDGADGVSVSRTSQRYNTAGHWLLVTEEAARTVAFHEDDADYEQPEDDGPRTVLLTRKLAANAWNSFCAPFDISESELQSTFGADTRAAEFTGFTDRVLHFTTVHSLTAGQPYLLRPTQVRDDNTYTFTDKSTFAAEPLATTVTSAPLAMTVTFQGSFTPTVVAARSYVVGNGNKLYHLTADQAMKGFRAYLTVTTASESKLIEWTLDETTAITLPETDAPAPFDVYNLNGQLIKQHVTTTDGLPKGVYIVDGQKRIVE